MPKRSDSVETVVLTLELLRRIPKNRLVSASQLHAQLAEAGILRDLRTVQRQLEMLTEHFEIERNVRNKPYGYKWKERATGFALPGLGDQECLLLSLAEQHLHNLLPANLMKSMEGFFSQARSKLGYGEKAVYQREWLSKVRVVSETQPLLPPTIADGVLEEVSNALYHNRWLEMDYRNSSGKETHAQVMPLGLAQQGARLYLVCRFMNYEDERSLAVHRIVTARTTTLNFQRPKDFDLRKYDNDGQFGFGQGKRIKLSFRIGKGAGFHLLESPLSADQKVKELEEQYQITATVVETAQLEWWLRGFGNQVTNIRRRRVEE